MNPRYRYLHERPEDDLGTALLELLRLYGEDFNLDQALCTPPSPLPADLEACAMQERSIFHRIDVGLVVVSISVSYIE